MGLWAKHVVPGLIDQAGRSPAVRGERQRWVPRAHGHVLELGVGSGLNLAFYDPARVARVTGIDPSAPLLARAASRVARAAVPVELIEGSAERLPFDPGSFDSALVTYSLCSIDEPVRALTEVRRVLRPGGQLVFVEHGLAPDAGTRWLQRRLTPIWRRFTGGCRLDRDLPAVLRDAGFAVDDLTTGYNGVVRWLSYTYEGTARPV
ncbi:MAG TPA: methyltransferase domain-containing protein [Kofleriaceae bacterium]|nr:methyltransferase domain-containing protein [Kofleriaceae bacterium]